MSYIYENKISEAILVTVKNDNDVDSLIILQNKLRNTLEITITLPKLGWYVWRMLDRCELKLTSERKLQLGSNSRFLI